jgi:hypothetical protein
MIAKTAQERRHVAQGGTGQKFAFGPSVIRDQCHSASGWDFESRSVA